MASSLWDGPGIGGFCCAPLGQTEHRTDACLVEVAAAARIECQRRIRERGNAEMSDCGNSVVLEPLPMVSNMAAAPSSSVPARTTTQ